MGFRNPPHSKVISIGNQSTAQPSASQNHKKGLVTILPYAQDNYSYCFHGDETDVFFDLGDAKVVETATKNSASADGSKRKLVVFLTHYHHDHTAGIYEVKDQAEVYGTEKSQYKDHLVKDGDKITVDRFEILAIHTPCHTRDHMCYRVLDTKTQAKYLVTGDCLFIAGTGKLFEGSGDQMVNCIQKLLSVCDGDEIMLVGHEYSDRFLLFSLDVEPNNEDALRKYVWCHERRAKELPTVGFSTLNDEKTYNAFFRWDSPSIREQCSSAQTPGEIVDYLHKRKDKLQFTKAFDNIQPRVKEYMRANRGSGSSNDSLSTQQHPQ